MTSERAAVVASAASEPSDPLLDQMPTGPLRNIELRVAGHDEPLDPKKPNPGFSERKEAVFVVNTPKESGIRLVVDDEPLEVVESDEADETRWTWTPGFYAGEVRARLTEADGRTAGTYQLDVSPDAEKIGSGIFEKMVTAIQKFDPALLLGEEPSRRQMGAVGPTDDPLVLFERLRRRRDPIDLALASIRREPATVLRPKRRFTPLREVRRADLQTLRAALHSPQALACLPVARSRQAEPPRDDVGGPEPIFDTPDVERTRDSPANRAALVMLRALIRRSVDLPGRLEERLAQRKDSDTRTSLTHRVSEWKRVLHKMERGFREVERRPPFSEVTRAEITAAGLNAVAAHPLYSRFWQVAWAALRPGVRLNPADLLPLAPTWEIYERWCFVTLAERLEKWLPDYSWCRPRPKKSKRPDVRCVVGRRENRTVVLRLQNTFSRPRDERGKKKRGRKNGWAVTRKRVPDLLLTIEEDGRVTRFVLLDSKYTAKSLRNHVGETAHKYQDGLRWGNDALRPSATLILTPTDRGAPWLAEEPFVRKYRVGAVELRPDSGPPAWFRDFLLAPPRPLADP